MWKGRQHNETIFHDHMSTSVSDVCAYILYSSILALRSVVPQTICGCGTLLWSHHCQVARRWPTQRLCERLRTSSAMPAAHLTRAAWGTVAHTRRVVRGVRATTAIQRVRCNRRGLTNTKHAESNGVLLLHLSRRLILCSHVLYPPTFLHLDNYYLMYPALTNTPNSLTFSGCSAGSIATAVALRGSCLITKADADAIANVPGQGTTAMAEKTTPTIEPCLESLSPIGCYIFCRAEGFTFSLHVQTYKGCPNVCFCSMVEDGSIATPDASTTSTTAAATTSPTTTTTTTTPTPAAVTTAQSGYMRLVPCPTCGYNSPDNKRNGREDKNTKLKFRLKVNCPQGHAFHFCIKRRSEGDSINSILRAKHLNGLEIARVTVEVGEDYKCWSLVLPAAYASQDSIFFLKTKSDSYFQVQTNVAKVRSPLDCVAL